TLGRFFITLDDQVAYDPKAQKDVLQKNSGEGLAVLAELRKVLLAVDTWVPSEIDLAIKKFADEKKLGMGKVAQPLRVAVSGSTVSPPIGETLAILGKDATLPRPPRGRRRAERSVACCDGRPASRSSGAACANRLAGVPRGAAPRSTR